MNSTTRKVGRPADPARCARRREEILEAAVQLFAAHGYPDTDMQVLADTLGVGKGTLYRYFPSKQDLFLAAADDVMRRLAAAVDEAIAGIDDPLEQIRRAIHTYLAHVTAHPELAELLIQERAQFKDRKKPTYFEYRAANAERWRARYRKLIAQGRIRDIPVERISDVVGNLLYGTMFANYFNGPTKPAAEQADEIIDIVFFGILSEPERLAGEPGAGEPGV
jgi:AcrR family transcriptional regulator